jgi:acid phosphatase
MSRTLLSLALLVCCYALSVSAERHRRHVRTHIDIQHAQQQHTLIDPNYTPIMAYHEEPQRPPKPLYEAQWDVEDFHTNGGYDTEMTGVVNNAQLFAAAGLPNNNSAWVFDVDETSLSGYTEMLSIGFGYVSKLNHDWIMESSAPAIPQTLALYNQLIQAGFKVIFLTGRKDIENAATVLNLQKQGYQGFEFVQTRIPSEYNLTATVYKSNRRTQFVEQMGYEILGCVGDQWSDLNGPYTGFKVKLPNYIYFLP